MELENLLVYQLSMTLADKIWNIVTKWNTFERMSIGGQIVRASDSIGANISEGFGRYNFKDSKRFLYYARGSLSETKTWLTKASNRNLIDDTEFYELIVLAKDLNIRLNNYIKSIGNTKNEFLDQ